MLREALQYLFGEAVATADAKAALKEKVTEVPFPSDGRTKTFLHNGELIEKDVPADLRAHSVDSVADIVAAAQRWKTKNIIFISGREVVLVLDDDDRRETVTMDLKQTALFETLAKLNESPKMDQTQLIRLLRRDLRKATEAEKILPLVRNIKFKQHTEGSSFVQHGSESLGRTIENEVLGIDKDNPLPSLIVVNTSVYQNPGEEVFSLGIGLDLEILTTEQKFVLKPMPGDLEAAIEGAKGSIRKRLVEQLKEAGIFFGSL